MQSTQSFTTQLSDYCTCPLAEAKALTLEKCKNCVLTSRVVSELSSAATYQRPDFIELGVKCKCACHLFKNGSIADEQACQGRHRVAVNL